MARITERNALFNANDYAVVSLRHADFANIITGVIWRRADIGKYYFLSNDDRLDGSAPCDLDSSGFRFSWASIHCPMSLSVDDAVRKFERSDRSFRLNNFYSSGNNNATGIFSDWVTRFDGENSDESRDSNSVHFEPDVFISNRYERDAIYRGQHHYHRHHGEYMNKPLSDGNSDYLIGVELEVEFGSRVEAMRAFNNAPSNWFYRETDSSLGSGGVEIITVPMLPDDAKDETFWKPLVDSIKPYARSWDTGRCGLHVHIGRNIMGNPRRDDHSEVIGKLLYFYHHCLKDTGINTSIYGRSHGYHEAEGKTDTSRAVDLLGASTVLKHKDVQERVKDSLINRSHDERYFDINLLNSETIEFRKGRGSIDTKRIVGIIEWSEIIVRYAKSTPWESISYSDFGNFLKAININSTLIKEQVQRYF